MADVLRDLADVHGPRFTPRADLVEMAAPGEALLRHLSGRRGAPRGRRPLPAVAVAYLLLLLVLRLSESRLLYVARQRGTLEPPPAELVSAERVRDRRAPTACGLVALGHSAPRRTARPAGCSSATATPATSPTSAGPPTTPASARSASTCFAFDYRGYGESGGTPTEPGLYRDAEAAYRYLRDRLGVPPERIVIFGHSLGSAVAVELATREPAAGLVLDGALDLGRGPGAGGVSLTSRCAGSPGAASPRSRRSRASRCPKLFLHARDDEVIPFEPRPAAVRGRGPAQDFVALRAAMATPSRWIRRLLRRHRSTFLRVTPS